MKLNPFKNKEKTSKAKSKAKPENVEEGKLSGETHEESDASGSSAFLGTGGTDAYRILRGFYISEKSSLGNTMDQYVFRVFPDANKSEVKKEVSKLFNVKVKSVKILNMPEKRRDFGRHPGTRSGFKKAIVVLQKGYSIGQAKP